MQICIFLNVRSLPVKIHQTKVEVQSFQLESTQEFCLRAKLVT